METKLRVLEELKLLIILDKSRQYDLRTITLISNDNIWPYLMKTYSINQYIWQMLSISYKMWKYDIQLHLKIFDNIWQILTKFSTIWQYWKISNNLSISDNIWQNWSLFYKVKKITSNIGQYLKIPDKICQYWIKSDNIGQYLSIFDHIYKYITILLLI